MKRFYSHKVNGGTIDIIPANKFRATSAIEVHVRGRSSNKYGVYASSLTPAVTMELKKLTSKVLENRETLPFMAGLIEKNNLIPDGMNEKINNVTKKYNCDLHELPLEVLVKELNFFSAKIHFLSPIDANVELIRLAIEDGQDLYGLDSDIYPIFCEEKTHFPDFVDCTIDNEFSKLAFCEWPHISDHRAQIMAARLNTLQKQYNNVLAVIPTELFKSVIHYLRENVVEAHFPEGFTTIEEKEFVSVCIQPEIASSVMDLFPHVAVWYEEMRLNDRLKMKGHLNYKPEYLRQQISLKFYEDWFKKPSVKKWQEKKRLDDLSKIDNFEEVCSNISHLNGSKEIQFSEVLQTAQTLMSPEFYVGLALAYTKLDWLKPGDLDIVNSIKSTNVDRVFKIEGSNRGFNSTESIDLTGDSAIIELLPDIDWEKGEDPGGLDLGFSSHYTWEPWDCAISSLAIEARSISDIKKTNLVSEKFDGNMHHGINIRETIKNYAKGRDEFVVNRMKKELHKNREVDSSGFPVVVLFNPFLKTGASISSMGLDNSKFVKHMNDESLIKKYHLDRAGSVGMLRACTINSSELPNPNGLGYVKRAILQGFTLYNPICWNNRQFAKWIEKTQLKNDPNYGAAERKSGLDVKIDGNIESQDDWAANMIGAAIPYAKNVLTVVSPENWEIPKWVMDRALDLGVEIHKHTLNSFDPILLEHVQKLYLAPLITTDVENIHPEWVSEVIGQHPKELSGYVPEEWYSFGLDYQRDRGGDV